MIENTPQVVNINAKDFFRKTMVLASHEDFAMLIAETVAQADEPDILADIVKRHLTTGSTWHFGLENYKKLAGAYLNHREGR